MKLTCLSFISMILKQHFIVAVWFGATLFSKPIALSLSKSTHAKGRWATLRITLVIFSMKMFLVTYLWFCPYCVIFTGDLHFWKCSNFSFFSGEKQTPHTISSFNCTLKEKNIGLLVHHVLDSWKTVYVAFQLLGLFGRWSLQRCHI